MEEIIFSLLTSTQETTSWFGGVGYTPRQAWTFLDETLYGYYGEGKNQVPIFVFKTNRGTPETWFFVTEME